MKENEPKVKDSQKYWQNYGYDDKDFKPEFKATYDRLVSLEAKIEVLEELEKRGHFYPALHNSKTELAELVKELKLS